MYIYIYTYIHTYTYGDDIYIYNYIYIYKSICIDRTSLGIIPPSQFPPPCTRLPTTRPRQCSALKGTSSWRSTMAALWAIYL